MLITQSSVTVRQLVDASPCRACERSVSGRFAAQRSSLSFDTRSPLRGLPLRAPFPLKRFLECPLTAPLPLTRFSARSAPCFPPFTLRSRALITSPLAEVISWADITLQTVRRKAGGQSRSRNRQIVRLGKKIPVKKTAEKPVF